MAMNNVFGLLAASAIALAANASADEALFNANCSGCHGQYTPEERLRRPELDLRARTVAFVTLRDTLRSPPAGMRTFSEADIDDDHACSLFVYLRSVGMSGAMAGCDAPGSMPADPPPPPAPPEPAEPTPPPAVEPEEEPDFDPMALSVDRVRVLKCDVGGTWNRFPSTGDISPRALAKFSIVRNAELNDTGFFDVNRPLAQNWWLEVPIEACEWSGLAGDRTARGRFGDFIRLKMATREHPFRGLYRWDLQNYFEMTSADNVGRVVTPERRDDGQKIEFSDYGRKVDLDRFEPFFRSLRDESKHTYFVVEASPHPIVSNNRETAYRVVGVEQIDKPD